MFQNNGPITVNQASGNAYTDVVIGSIDSKVAKSSSFGKDSFTSIDTLGFSGNGLALSVNSTSASGLKISVQTGTGTNAVNLLPFLGQYAVTGGSGAVTVKIGTDATNGDSITGGAGTREVDVTLNKPETVDGFTRPMKSCSATATSRLTT